MARNLLYSHGLPFNEKCDLFNRERYHTFREAPMRFVACRSVRLRSKAVVFGLPVWEIAYGPDGKLGQRRGHAKAWVAIGDIATGGLAIGGVARGAIAIGGVACGGLVLGGVAFGAVGLGGVAIAVLALGDASIGVVALGGASVGYVAVGGAALGYYACGAAAAGRFVYSIAVQDPEMTNLMNRWFGG